MTSESLETGGRAARKAVSEAGFSEELKKQLEERLANASFKSEHAQAFATSNLPDSAGQGTRDLAGARPWTGTESVEDATLRMLNDAHKPMRVPPRVPGVRAPTKVDTGRSRGGGGSGARLANARDKTSMYSYLKDPSLSEQEREQMRKELKERFTPGARAVPSTLQGLSALANERIEDAIARGQFKNLPRGKKIERDYNADSPFLDTTEYFMNKIIQRQDIVPPWIEKQQELVSTATRFRSRLRVDWKRHVARTIASKGGSLDKRVALAEEYARAEAIDNPPKTKVEQLNAVDEDGNVSQITLAGELKATPVVDTSNAGITIAEQRIDSSGQPLDGGAISVTVSPASTFEDPRPVITDVAPSAAAVPPPPPPPSTPAPTVSPFRDDAWLQTELSYHQLAIDNLNSLTRSYNLMAPNLARKPYFNLDRELRACYADVAPQVADEIRRRASAPTRRVEEIGHGERSVMARFTGKGKAVVYDERRPKYGLKEFWRDLFAKET
ncbi:hypothetical protein CAC42_2840 [Sphaceloma murrayae]|uniref:DnaJ homologue subfamily C member 28 conserved domain-containing protein n=1 Tax=Sphaceloma murrayae TaxID=2082308 RepID=A0A2K1R0S3_9PEZI|nr:hypothetical protein CAC42_2840 [Sphaceloma murrayae]